MHQKISNQIKVKVYLGFGKLSICKNVNNEHLPCLQGKDMGKCLFHLSHTYHPRKSG
jgi:hypothetical protein